MSTSYRGDRQFRHQKNDNLAVNELLQIENNTRVKELHGSILAIVFPETPQYTDVIDLSNTRLSHIQIIGFASHQNISIETYCSNDNIIFYEDIKEVFLISGTNIGATIFIPFKYVKFRLVASVGQAVTMSMIWATRE